MWLEKGAFPVGYFFSPSPRALGCPFPMKDQCLYISEVPCDLCMNLIMETTQSVNRNVVDDENFQWQSLGRAVSATGMGLVIRNPPS